MGSWDQQLLVSTRSKVLCHRQYWVDTVLSKFYHISSHSTCSCDFSDSKNVKQHLNVKIFVIRLVIFVVVVKIKGRTVTWGQFDAIRPVIRAEANRWERGIRINIWRCCDVVNQYQQHLTDGQPRPTSAHLTDQHFGHLSITCYLIWAAATWWSGPDHQQKEDVIFYLVRLDLMG